jgi:hypothetical protein
MRKIYNNHVFQRSTKPWQWLAIISLSVALLAQACKNQKAQSKNRFSKLESLLALIA